jgi:hypothetical protein
MFKTNDLKGYADASLNAKLNLQIATDTHFTTGFVNRTDSSLSFNNTDRVFTLLPLSGYDIYSNGIKFHKTLDSSIQITTDLGIHYIYYDGNGDLQTNTLGWSIVSENSPITTVYWNGTTGKVFEERHGAGRNLDWHLWAHDTIGCRYERGLAGTFSSSSTSIAPGSIHDEDIEIDILTQTDNNSIWYRAVGGATMTFDTAPSAVAAKVTNGVLQWDNGGTLTNTNNNEYVKNWVYASGCLSTPIIIVTSQAIYTGVNGAARLAAARAGAQPIMPNLISPELKLLYTVIWSNNGGTPTFQEATDYRTSSTVPGGGTTTINAASVTLSPVGDVIATTVQGGIAELSFEKATYVYVDGSLNNISARYIKDTSIGTGLYWVGGLLDVSVAGGVGDVTKLYVDGSLAVRDASITYLFNNSGGGSLATLSDTSIVSAEILPLQVLAWSADSSIWTNYTSTDSSLYSVVNASDYFWILADTSVNYDTIVNNQTLAYQVDSSKWVNKTLVDASLYSVVDASNYFTTRLQTSTKLATSDGSKGDWSIDASYLYVCLDASKWGRILFTTTW